jgi:uncharacterized membrane protein YhfC
VWLFRIAYHTFLNEERGRQAIDEFNEAAHGGSADTTASAVVELDIDRALERLPLRQRAVFDLHYKKGMTHSEIAAALRSVLTLALSPPLERVIASLTPWSISPLVLSTAAAVAVVLIPALIVRYAERADR